MQLIDLKTLGMRNPLGIDLDPYFSWTIDSDQRNVVQTAYRIVVEGESGEISWDSDLIEGEESTFICYQGAPLKSRTRYRWKLEVRDNKENIAGAAAFFETAYMNNSEWSAKWVEPSERPARRKTGFGNQPPATMFRKTFTVKSKVSSARMYVSCHGIYKLSVNGQIPDNRELAPEFTVYDKYLSYQTYDLLSVLEQGGNAVGLHVGDGWYCGPRTQTGKAKLNRRHAVSFEIYIRYENGFREQFYSDQDVSYGEGPVRASNLFDGELFDANYIQEDWDRPTFTDEHWRKVHVASYSFDNLVAQFGPPVRTVKKLPVSEIYRSSRGELIVDFGQVLAGRVRIKINSPAGTRIALDFFEQPEKNGNYFSNINEDIGMSADQRVEYVSDGIERWYEPVFTFLGFRYIRLEGLESIEKEDAEAVVLSSDMEDTGTFECSNPDLNRLYQNTRWSQLSNMISIPTDCPQREKAGWTGDILIYADTSMLNQDTAPFLIRWMKNLGFSQAANGAVPFTVPFTNFYKKLQLPFNLMFRQAGTIGAAGWGDAAVMVPWSIYSITGNLHVLKEQYESMKKWCGYIINQAKGKRGNRKLKKTIDKYLWNSGFHFGEWLIPSQNTDSKGINDLKKTVQSSSQYTAPIFGWQSVARMADIAGILGNAGDHSYFGTIAAKMKNALAEGLIDEDGKMPVELMGAYVLPIYFNLVPEKHRDSFAATLVHIIKENDYCLDTGFLGTPFLLDALCKIGRIDLAYRLLYQEKSPSWLNQVKNDATSIWESWISEDEEGNPIKMSLNHYAFGCIDDWMFRTITGIDKSAPGFKEIIIAPRPDDSLDYARRTFKCSYGEIVSSWKRQGGEFLLDVRIPANTKALIVMPDGEKFETGSGSYSFRCRFGEELVP